MLGHLAELVLSQPPTVGLIIVASIPIHVPADPVPTHRNPLTFSFGYSLHDVLEHISLPVIYVLR